MPDAKGVDAVDRALTILDCFGPETQALSLAELARMTGLYKSTILRLAASLESFGYIVRGEDGRFRLGPSTWRLGATYRLGFDLSAIMRAELTRLSQETQETASYYIREGDRRICLFRAEPSRSIRHSIVEGAPMPLDKGASGKVLLAFSDAPPPAFAGIREVGYAVSQGERDPEVAAVAVPVLSRGGRLLGALSVSGLVTRFTDDRLPDLVAALRASQANLAGQMIS
jgi:DNA-binding IclR family transcriptional regulator